MLPGLGESGGDYHYHGRLGRWLDNQRQIKKRGKLGAQKLALLQELVDNNWLYWDGSDMSMAGIAHTHDGVDWNKHYAALLEYGKLYNSCNVPQKFVFECIFPYSALGTQEPQANGETMYRYHGRLGRWLDNQRQFKKGNGGKLYSERERKFQALVDEGKLVWHTQSGTRGLLKDGTPPPSSSSTPLPDKPRRKREKSTLTSQSAGDEDTEWSRHYAAFY